MCAAFLVFKILLFVPLSEDDILREGIVCYNRLDYPCTIKKLKEAVSIYKANPEEALEEKMVTAFKYLAFTFTALGEEARAAEAFKQLLRIKGDFTLDRRTVSPKILKVFEKVKSSMKDELLSPSIKDERAFLLGVSTGWVLLSGRDEEKFYNGALLALHGFRKMWKNLSAGVVLDYHYHGVKAADGRGGLHIASLFPSVRWVLLRGLFFPYLSGGAGLTSYGRIHLNDRYGFTVKGGGGVDIKISRTLFAGIGVFPNLITTFEDSSSLSSFYVFLTGNLRGAF